MWDVLPVFETAALDCIQHVIRAPKSSRIFSEFSRHSKHEFMHNIYLLVETIVKNLNNFLPNIEYSDDAKFRCTGCDSWSCWLLFVLEVVVLLLLLEEDRAFPIKLYRKHDCVTFADINAPEK